MFNNALQTITSIGQDSLQNSDLWCMLEAAGSINLIRSIWNQLRPVTLKGMALDSITKHRFEVAVTEFEFDLSEFSDDRLPSKWQSEYQKRLGQSNPWRYSLTSYVPQRYLNHELITDGERLASSLVLSMKAGYNEQAISHFRNLLVKFMDQLPVFDTVLYIPGHVRDQHHICPEKVLRSLLNLNNQTSDLLGLFRRFSIGKRSSGCSASTQQKINSLELLASTKNAIQGKVVLLVDDVITRGDTMASAATFISQMGAASVIELGLTKTIYFKDRLTQYQS